ncbi:hypothetical protein C8Q74DRAFT_1215435 [Fomes fomentarius]|nr:hypothetical protein C8Q74DRAFT_1215435 [Fomes fomentarius]
MSEVLDLGQVEKCMLENLRGQHQGSVLEESRFIKGDCVLDPSLEIRLWREWAQEGPWKRRAPPTVSPLGVIDWLTPAIQCWGSRSPSNYVKGSTATLVMQMVQLKAFVREAIAQSCKGGGAPPPTPQGLDVPVPTPSSLRWTHQSGWMPEGKGVLVDRWRTHIWSGVLGGTYEYGGGGASWKWTIMEGKFSKACSSVLSVIDSGLNYPFFIAFDDLWWRGNMLHQGLWVSRRCIDA